MIIVVFFEPYPMGMGGNFLTQKLILERLDPSKYRPIVLAPRDGAALDYFRSMGVECLVIQPPLSLSGYGGVVLRAKLWRRVRSVFDLLCYNVQLARLFRNRNVDVVYANCVRAELCVGLGAWLARIPSLLYIKGELANPFIDRLCFLLASKILFFSGRNRDDRYPLCTRWFYHKIDILKIGLDPGMINDIERSDHSMIRKELDIDPTFVNTVVLAQLYRPKGQHFVIEALSRIVAEYPRVRLYLVGDHVLEEYRPYKHELEVLISKHGLDQHVRFTGWRKDAMAIASQMDIVLHPSLAEGFGRAVLESMALAKPVIVSAVGGLREAIDNERNGYLVPPGDVEALTRRWRELLGSPDLRQRLGREARQTVYTDYLIDDKVSRLTEIWSSMTLRRG